MGGGFQVTTAAVWHCVLCICHIKNACNGVPTNIDFFGSISILGSCNLLISNGTLFIMARGGIYDETLCMYKSTHTFLVCFFLCVTLWTKEIRSQLRM